jgi:cell division protein FtsB
MPIKINKEKFLKFLASKYSIVFILFAVYLTVFDEHSLINRWNNYKKIKKMEEEVKYYQNEIKVNKQKMNELQSSDENLEKFAREHYLMKRADEDIYIIKE